MGSSDPSASKTPNQEAVASASWTDDTRNASWDWVLKVEPNLKDVHQVWQPRDSWSVSLITGLTSTGTTWPGDNDTHWRAAMTSGSLGEKGLPPSDNERLLVFIMT